MLTVYFLHKKKPVNLYPQAFFYAKLYELVYDEWF